MSTTQNLKFIHLSAGSASAHKADTGAIIFEKATGRIAVAAGADKDVEYYGGGRVSNAEFDIAHKILTLSFNDGGDPIKLDFSDTASAEGVNAIMKAHADRISALETTVGKAAADGKPATGLVRDVADNKANIAANATAIQANANAIDLINHETNGILAKAKQYTNGELTTLKGGYTGTLKGLDDNIKSNDTDITNLQRLHASNGSNGKKTVAQEIIDKVGTGITGTVEAYVTSKVSDINSTAATLKGRVDTLESDVDTLETTVGNASSGLVKDVADLKRLHADKTEGGKKTVAEEVAAGVNAKVGAIDGTVKDYVDAAKEAANKYTDGKVSEINTTTDDLRKDLGQKTDAVSADTAFGRIKSLEDKVNDENTGLVKKVNTLVGTDANKSVRTIANEELAAQLIPAGAKESLDTLQEIAAWIQAHPDDASAMNGKIAVLEGKVGEPAAAEGGKPATGLYKAIADETVRATGIESGLRTDVKALQDLHVSGKTVAQEVTDGINKIAEASASAGTDVVVTVKTKSGSVSAVEVNASGLRNDLGESTAEAGTGTAFARIKALETTVGEPAKGEVAATGLHKEIADNKSAIKALQDAQASGSLMWSVWE